MSADAGQAGAMPAGATPAELTMAGAPSSGAEAQQVQTQDQGESQTDPNAAPEQPQPADPVAEAEAARGRKEQRFSELTKQRDAERAARLRLEGRLEATEMLLRNFGQPNGAQNAHPGVTVAPQGPQEPRPEDFPGGQFDPDFIEARAVHRAEQRFEQRMAEQAKAAEAETARRESIQRFETVLVEAEQNGWEDAAVVLESRHVPVDVKDAIARSETGALTARWLYHNQDALKAILGQPDPFQRALMIGRIDGVLADRRAAGARAAAQPTPKAAPAAAEISQTPPAVPQAPASASVKPMQGLVSARAGAGALDPNSMTMEQYFAWRNSGGSF